MNLANLPALVGAITALVTAVSALIASLTAHGRITRQQLDQAQQADPPAQPGPSKYS